MRNRTYTNMKRACLMLLAAALAVAGCKKENVDGDAAGTETGTAAPRWRQSWKSGNLPRQRSIFVFPHNLPTNRKSHSIVPKGQ